MGKRENDSEIASGVEHRTGSKVSAGGDSNTFTPGRPDARTTGYPKVSSGRSGMTKSGSGKIKDY